MLDHIFPEAIGILSLFDQFPDSIHLLLEESKLFLVAPLSIFLPLTREVLEEGEGIDEVFVGFGCFEHALDQGIDHHNFGWETTISVTSFSEQKQNERDVRSNQLVVSASFP